MADMMMFPKTVDEFMEKYKIIDTEEVYTNGAELVPIFRMKQWFEHANAEPVRHGHWIFNPKDAIEMMFTLPKCSECGAESSDGGNYCPNCGAKMDEVEDG